MVSGQHDATDIDSLTNGYYLERGWNKDVAVFLKEIHRTDKSPCSPDPSDSASSCISRCFHRALAGKIGCRMPYMTTTALPLCNGSRQLQEAEDVATELLWEGKGWHPADCRCGQEAEPTSCSQSVYETYADSFTRDDNCTSYQVYFNDMTYEETREEFAYDVIALLCDIGGTLGLLLGASGESIFIERETKN